MGRELRREDIKSQGREVIVEMELCGGLFGGTFKIGKSDSGEKRREDGG